MPHNVEVRYYHTGGRLRDLRGAYDSLDYLMPDYEGRPELLEGVTFDRVVIIQSVELIVTQPQIFAVVARGDRTLPSALYDGTKLIIEAPTYAEALARLVALAAADRRNAAMLPSSRQDGQEPSERNSQQPVEEKGSRTIQRGHLILIRSSRLSSDATTDGSSPEPA